MGTGEIRGIAPDVLQPVGQLASLLDAFGDPAELVDVRGVPFGQQRIKLPPCRLQVACQGVACLCPCLRFAVEAVFVVACALRPIAPVSQLCQCLRGTPVFEVGKPCCPGKPPQVGFDLTDRGVHEVGATPLVSQLAVQRAQLAYPADRRVDGRRAEVRGEVGALNPGGPLLFGGFRVPARFRQRVLRLSQSRGRPLTGSAGLLRLPCRTVVVIATFYLGRQARACLLQFAQGGHVVHAELN